MAVSVRTTRILGALVVSGVLIGGSFVLSTPNLSIPFFDTKIANAASTQSLLEAYAQKVNAQGVPLWEAALGTIPTAATSSSPQDIVDSIPGQLPAQGTLTQQFSQDFFEAYTNAISNSQANADNSDGSDDGTGDNSAVTLSASDEQALVTQMLTEFSQKAQVLLQSNYTLVDVNTDPAESVSSYAGAVERVIEKHNLPAANADPIALMQAYIQDGDQSSLTQLQTLANSYTGIASDLATISVPPSLANDQLSLMQSFDSLGKATNAIVNFQKDPAVTLGAIGIYQPASEQMMTAMQGIAETILANGEPAPGQPGFIIVNIARSAQQTATST